MKPDDHASLVALLRHAERSGNTFVLVDLDTVELRGPKLPADLLDVAHYWATYLPVMALYPPEHVTACTRCSDLFVPNTDPQRACLDPDCSGIYSVRVPTPFAYPKESPTP